MAPPSYGPVRDAANATWLNGIATENDRTPPCDVPAASAVLPSSGIVSVTVHVPSAAPAGSVTVTVAPSSGGPSQVGAAS